MTIYRVDTDGSKYQYLDLNVTDFLDSFPDELSYKDCHFFNRLNLTLGSFWPSMKTGFKEVVGGENLMPEITIWHDTTFLLSPNAYRYTFDSLKAYGEFLPIHIEGEVWYIFNCTSIADVDDDKTTQNAIVFDRKSVSNKLVFKCTYPFALGLYCTDRFKKLIGDCGLAGLSFHTKRDLLVEEFNQVIE